MFKAPYSIKYLDKKSDARGNLFEILRFQDDQIPAAGYIYTFSVNPGQRRGDHFHKQKHEWFSCVYGQVLILIEFDGHKEQILLSADKPAVLYFAPGTAHTIVNQSEDLAVLVSYGSKQHDANNPDTFKKIIEL